jgi:hypothetical protein
MLPVHHGKEIETHDDGDQRYTQCDGFWIVVRQQQSADQHHTSRSGWVLFVGVKRPVHSTLRCAVVQCRDALAERAGATRLTGRASRLHATEAGAFEWRCVCLAILDAQQRCDTELEQQCRRGKQKERCEGRLQSALH